MFFYVFFVCAIAPFFATAVLTDYDYTDTVEVCYTACASQEADLGEGWRNLPAYSEAGMRVFFRKEDSTYLVRFLPRNFSDQSRPGFKITCDSPFEYMMRMMGDSEHIHESPWPAGEAIGKFMKRHGCLGGVCRDWAHLFLAQIKSGSTDKITALIKSAISLENEETRILFTGRGSGGAFAQLAAIHALKNIEDSSEYFNTDHISVLTFGAFPIFSGALVTKIEELFSRTSLINVVAKSDPYPHWNYFTSPTTVAYRALGAQVKLGVGNGVETPMTKYLKERHTYLRALGNPSSGARIGDGTNERLQPFYDQVRASDNFSVYRSLLLEEEVTDWTDLLAGAL